ncbi:carbonic anhydrase [Propionivibrio sp.]|uniref:carbonic anhydrase n=1 Tax=Propionivibrio sp. TaxID=2212460 RepID=UPI003BF346CB
MFAMHRTSPFTLLLLAALLPTPAQAAKWVAISSRDQARIEVDTSSIHSASDGKLRIWHREIHARPKTPDSGAFSFSRLTVLTEFQCDKQLAAPIQRSYTTADGTELKSENFDSREPKPIIPDSSLEAVFSYACKHRNKPVAVKEVAPPPAVPAPAPETHDKPKGGKKSRDNAPAEAPHWSYTGNTGADKWGSLGNEFVTCSVGQRQSPIDIRKTIRADLPPIQFAYKPVPLSIVDNGHSIKVDTPDAGGITVEGESYELLQLHFHKPSEEKLNGKTYAMVVHLVHQSKAGKLAVVAVMMEAGKEQNLIRTLWTNLPLEKGKPVTRPEIKIDPTLLIPAKRNYYTFLGSLTTPPCTEGVLWLVLKTPMQVSREQLAGFGTIYKNNVRPVQAVNSRVIKESR